MAESSRTVTLPITGMTCANCVATIERNLKKLDGVQVANVNLASERASVEFDPARLGATVLVERIRRAGYDVALGEANLGLVRLGDSVDAQRLEKALVTREGIETVVVNLATEEATVTYVPGEAGADDVLAAIERAGDANRPALGLINPLALQTSEREVLESGLCGLIRILSF